ncbi:MAG: hypothetical protein ACR2NN_08445 [Bryobacteraceae bacterium]
MKFECKDLERALEVPELMPDAREHARDCPGCRRELWVWAEMSRIASGLRDEWESPELWTRVRQSLDAEPKPKQVRRWDWRLMVGVAAALLIAASAALWYPMLPHPARPAQTDEAFLTDQALKQVEQAESSYAKSIEKLSHVAESKLQGTQAPLAAAYKEKLVMLDSAIAELKTTVDQNRFNAKLQAELAALYKEKQQTLQEILQREQKN